MIIIVKLKPPNAKDEFYLVNMDAFLKIVCPEDLARRNFIEIKNAFQLHWFKNIEGENYFHAPEFFLTNGVARFINGRHRTLMLSKHLKDLPMALTNIDGYPFLGKTPSEVSQAVLKSITISKLNGDETFDFPDLPIEYLGFDLNIGK